MLGRLVLGTEGLLVLAFMTFAFGIYGLLATYAPFVIIGWRGAARN